MIFPSRYKLFQQQVLIIRSRDCFNIFNKINWHRVHKRNNEFLRLLIFAYLNSSRLTFTDRNIYNKLIDD